MITEGGLEIADFSPEQWVAPFKNYDQTPYENTYPEDTDGDDSNYHIKRFPANVLGKKGIIETDKIASHIMNSSKELVYCFDGASETIVMMRDTKPQEKLNEIQFARLSMPSLGRLLTASRDFAWAVKFPSGNILYLDYPKWRNETTKARFWEIMVAETNFAFRKLYLSLQHKLS